jgi:hypothetical protein
MNEINQQNNFSNPKNNNCVINEDIDSFNKENNINSNNISINNSVDNVENNNNPSYSKTSNRVSLSNLSQLQIPLSPCNPSQFSFKPKSNVSFSISNNNSLDKYITPQKNDNRNAFEKMLTVEKLRSALAPSNEKDDKDDEIFRSRTDAKHFPKYPEFKNVTLDDLPELEIMILDDVDKKTFNIYKNMNFPPIEEITEIMKDKSIKEEDFDYYSSVSYLLFLKRKEFLPNQRHLVLKNIPFNDINDFFINNQSYSFYNDSSINNSSSTPASFSFPTKNINTLCMILNIIIFCIQSDEDTKMFIENYGKDEVFFFIDNMCFLLQKIECFRLKRKIIGLLIAFFQYNDDIILNFFRKIENIIIYYNISSNVITKLQQIMKNKQKYYINLIISNKIGIKEKIKKNEIDSICYLIRFFIYILSGSQGSYIFDEKEYVNLLKCFRELNIKNQTINELIVQLKIRIKRLV